MRSLVVLLALAIALTAASAAPAKTRRCGIAGGKGVPGVDVRVVKGRVPCERARTVIRTYLRTDRAPAGWRCRDGREDETLVAKCTYGTRHDVRAYPARGIHVPPGES